MELVSTGSLNANRVYFTEFDRVTYSQVAWTKSEVEAIKRNLQRKLKLIALIKGHIIIAASHLLESELAHEILLPYPRLFSEGLVVPALRTEFTKFEGFLDSKLNEGKESAQYEGGARREMAQMLDSEVALAVKWEVNQTSGWFKERLLSDLTDEHSLLHSCLRKSGTIVPQSLITQIRETPRLSRQDVYISAKETGVKKLWYTICDYADFIYYLSGAKAVCSEGILPQENLMDFSLSDLAEGRTHLSEKEVFFKIFIDLIKTATQTHFPVDILDSLSLNDVLDLHFVAIENNFINKYNLIQEKTKDGLSIRDPERLVLLMEELEQFEHQLHNEYRSAIEKELPRYLRTQIESKLGNLLIAIANLLVTPLGIAASIKDIVISILDFTNYKQIARQTRHRIQQRIKAQSRLLDRAIPEGKPIFLEFTKRLRERYAENIMNG